MKEVESMNLLEKINSYVQKGFYIDYQIVNQYENGCGDMVDEGRMPEYTYTVYVKRYNSEDILFELSVDTLEECFKEALKFLEKN